MNNHMLACMCAMLMLVLVLGVAVLDVEARDHHAYHRSKYGDDDNIRTYTHAPPLHSHATLGKPNQTPKVRAPRTFRFDAGFGFEDFEQSPFDVDPAASRRVNQDMEGTAATNTHKKKKHTQSSENNSTVSVMERAHKAMLASLSAPSLSEHKGELGDNVVMAQQADNADVMVDTEHKGFDPEDPTSMRGRPDEDTRWNRY